MTEVCFNGNAILKAFENGTRRWTRDMDDVAVLVQLITLRRHLWTEHGGLESFSEVALGIVKEVPSYTLHNDEAADSHSHSTHGRNGLEVDDVGADLNDDEDADEPAVSPSDLASSPQLSMSDFEIEVENGDSSLEDDNPIGAAARDGVHSCPARICAHVAAFVQMTTTTTSTRSRSIRWTTEVR